MYLGKEFYLTRGVWYGDFRFNIRIFTCMEDVGMSYPFLNGAVSESEWGGGGAVGISPPIVEVLKKWNVELVSVSYSPPLYPWSSLCEA